MGATQIFVIAFCMIALSILLSHINIFDLIYGKQDVDLAVCILSARDNFDYRDAIRRSWLNDFQTHTNKISAVAKFVLGNMDCPIHPKDRLDPYECQRWEPKIPGDLASEAQKVVKRDVKSAHLAFIGLLERTSEIAAFSMVARKESADCQIVIFFYVKVMHDVILRSVGVAEIFPFDSLDSNESVQVTLYCSVTNEEVTSVRFTQEQGIRLNGFLYKPVQEVQLPKTLSSQVGSTWMLKRNQKWVLTQ